MTDIAERLRGETITCRCAARCEGECGCGSDWPEAAAAEAADEIERLREALTPSGDTKAAYMGEFAVSLPDFDGDGNEIMRTINVPWTTIKEIMAAIRRRSEMSPKRTQGR